MRETVTQRIRSYAFGALGGVKRIVFGVVGLMIAGVFAGIAIIALGLLAIGLALLVSGVFFAVIGYVSLKIARRVLR